MNANKLLMINALINTADQFVYTLDSIKDELYNLQEDVSEHGDDETALETAAIALVQASTNAEKARESLDTILETHSNVEGSANFFDSLSREDGGDLLNSWVSLYHPDYSTFSPEWMDRYMPHLFSEAEQSQIRAIYQRGLDWFETRLRASSVK
jgi:hypothetical protein